MGRGILQPAIYDQGNDKQDDKVDRSHEKSPQEFSISFFFSCDKSG